MSAILKVILSFFFSLHLLTMGVSSVESVKLPFLIEHYLQHSGTTEVSFLEYLALHYDNPEHLQSDQEQHKKLPIQQTHVCQDCISIFDLPPLSTLPLPASNLTSISTINQSLPLYISSSSPRYLECIFQPPKA